LPILTREWYKLTNGFFAPSAVVMRITQCATPVPLATNGGEPYVIMAGTRSASELSNEFPRH
jgi:hypothetical protein